MIIFIAETGKSAFKYKSSPSYIKFSLILNSAAF